MGSFVNPTNTAFSKCFNSEIYVDKSELIVFTNKVRNPLFFTCLVLCPQCYNGVKGSAGIIIIHLKISVIFSDHFFDTFHAVAMFGTIFFGGYGKMSCILWWCAPAGIYDYDNDKW